MQYCMQNMVHAEVLTNKLATCILFNWVFAPIEHLKKQAAFINGYK